MITAFQSNAFQTVQLAFQIDVGVEVVEDFWRPFKRERRQVYGSRLPVLLRMR